jgi:protein involved in polysaccharide export with SLBB domain
LLVAKAGAQQPAESPQEAALAGAYRLGAGDTVEFKFTYETSLNETVTVRPDGRISLAIIGEVVAEGLTPAELSTAVESAYARSFKRPEVATIVREFVAQRAYVGGEVQAPTVMPLKGHVTALQAVLSSGGPTPAGRLDAVLLLRYRDRQTVEARRLNMKKIMAREEADVVLQPYDVVYVPMSRIAKVGKFFEQYVNAIVPRALIFPYNINQTVVVDQAR